MKVRIFKMKYDDHEENESNEVKKNKCFKYINTSEKFKFDGCIREEDIKAVSSYFKCLRIKEISGIECRNLNNKKLIICGAVDINFYVEECSRCFYVEKVLPVSTFMIIPEKINNIDIYYYIEDITVIKIDDENVLISVVLLLEAGDYDKLSDSREEAEDKD